MAKQSNQLSRRFLLSGAALAVVVTFAAGLIASGNVRTALKQQAHQRSLMIAGRVATQVGSWTAERRHETITLATLPAVVAAARTGGEQVAAQGLDRLSLAQAEQARASTRQLGGDPDLASFLRGYPARSEVVELFFTEAHGFTVLASGRTSDFAQQDEEWWQATMRTGSFEGEPRYDSSAATVSVEYDVAIRPAPGARPIGVLKAVFGLTRMRAMLSGPERADNAYLEVVDNQSRILVSQDPSRRPLTQLPESERRSADSTWLGLVAGPTGPELVASVPTNDGHWRVLYRQGSAAAYSSAGTAAGAIWTAALGVLALMLALLFALGRWLDRRVTEPVRAAAVITGQVAGGDLTVTVASREGDSAETRDLLSSVHTMVGALRRLVGAIRAAADESAAMAAQISAATQQMSASTEEMTGTTQDLTKRAAEQAQLVRAAAEDSNRILQIASVVAGGAEDSVRRNAELAALARHHKGMLDQSVTQLTKLAEDVERGAQEAEALTGSSTEIQKFVGQAKAVATQTNMLALNAAIEAARAGPQGRGFAVVADEVRKLASLAAAGATETADTVRGVLNRVQATRDRLQRLAQTGAAAREAAQTAAEGLARVAGEAEANDAWSQEIATSALEVRRLVDEIAARLNAVAQGTDGLLASAEEIAASSEQQSASTQEIASSSNQLAEAADRLQGAVKTFRIVADQPPEPPPPPSAEPHRAETEIGPDLTPEAAT